MRPVLVSLHAHPDDEAIFTGGTIASVESGWRVVLVVATDGDLGSSPASGADVATHRRAEALAAAVVLGIERVEFLGYGDSGYLAPAGDSAGSWAARARGLRAGTLADAFVGGAARHVRDILVEEVAAVLTSYDANGVYGHIDHVLVHEIAARSVEDTDCALVEATISRHALRDLRSNLLSRGLVSNLWPPALVEQVGVEDGPDLVSVDVTAHLVTKLTAVAAHSSQVVEAATFMGLPAGAFHHLLGTEWFRVARPGDGRFLDLLGSVGRADVGPFPDVEPDAGLLVTA
ncbi:MAG TPA: PIG-L family deacetylase [Acidimicrobiales bacterium]